MIRAVLVDDEPRARESLRIILSRFFHDVAIVGEAAGVDEAYDIILKEKPNTVFLDIKMPDGSGFDLLNRFDRVDFKVIFVTAFEEYALDAIKFSALDYILKPINTNELRAALDKLRETLGTDDDLNVKLKALNNNMHATDQSQKKLVLKTNESIHLVLISSIIRCEADCNYTWFYISEQPKLLISKPLKYFEDLLLDFSFIRVHQSHLVNINHITRIDKADGGSLVLTDKSLVPISSRKRDHLYKTLGQL